MSCERAVVVGNGNVAVDVARILARDTDELGRTDIAAHALEALRASRVREVVMLGRRGPAQAAFTPKELKELGELSGVDVIVDPAALDLDAVSAAHLEATDDGQARKILALLAEFADRPRTGGRSIELRFLTSPVEIAGDGRVEEIRVESNLLVAGPDGVPRTQGTGEVSAIACGLVLTAVGYLGAALPGVPFDSRRGVVPNDHGRVLDHTGAPVAGEYAVGWIKRGPTGIIGTNKPDAVESVDALLADAAAGVLVDPAHPDRADAEARLRYLRPEHTTYADWQIIDALEQARGAAGGRGRAKFTRISEMLDALAGAKQDGREHAAD